MGTGIGSYCKACHKVFFVPCTFSKFLWSNLTLYFIQPRSCVVVMFLVIKLLTELKYKATTNLTSWQPEVFLHLSNYIIKEFIKDLANFFKVFTIGTCFNHESSLKRSDSMHQLYSSLCITSVIQVLETTFLRHYRFSF